MKRITTLILISILILAGCAPTARAENGIHKKVKSLDQAIDNLDGETITIATNSLAADNPYSEQAKDINDIQDKQKYVSQMLEDTGVKIEFVTLDPERQVEQVSQSVLAGDPIADIVRVNAGNYEALVRMGMLEDTTNISKLLLDDTRVENKWGIQIGNILGGYYAIGRNVDPRPELLAFDTELIKKAGMEQTPLDLWNDGNWTWDNAREYFLQIQSNLGSDYTVWSDYPSYITKHGIASSGVVAVMQDGKINYTDPGVYEAMDYYKKLYDDKILKFYFNQDGESDPQLAENEWVNGNSVFFTMQRWKTKIIAEQGKSFGLVPYPIKDGVDQSEVYWPAPAGDVYVIPKGVKDVDCAALVAYLEQTIGATDMPLGTTVSDTLELVATRDLAPADNQAVLEYVLEQSIYDPTGAFELTSDDAFDPSLAVEDYFINGTSLTAAMENGQKQLEANVKEIKTKQKSSSEELASDN